MTDKKIVEIRGGERVVTKLTANGVQITRHPAPKSDPSDPSNSTRKQRRIARIVSRQGNRCIYCGQKFSPARPATLEHLTPRSKGGRASLDNIAVSCRECNSDKAALTHDEYVNVLALRGKP